MSRGGLMLRCVLAGMELEYVPIAGATRHGQRPPKLAPIRGILKNGTPEDVSDDSVGRPFKGVKRR
jgi:hypothetical protein